uniref:Uncharacterized protein n=1 Tax=Plectus sambesii TaxID=2011161 RepID=A0A914VW55_9BILA
MDLFSVSYLYVYPYTLATCPKLHTRLPTLVAVDACNFMPHRQHGLTTYIRHRAAARGVAAAVGSLVPFPRFTPDRLSAVDIGSVAVVYASSVAVSHACGDLAPACVRPVDAH